MDRDKLWHCSIAIICRVYHTTKVKAIKLVRPYAGYAPVDVDFLLRYMGQETLNKGSSGHGGVNGAHR